MWFVIVAYRSSSLPQVGFYHCVSTGHHLYFVLRVTLRHNWPYFNHPTFRPDGWRIFTPRKAYG